MSDWLLTSCEIDIVLGTKVLFQECTEDVRAGLDNLDSGCGCNQTCALVSGMGTLFPAQHAWFEG